MSFFTFSWVNSHTSSLGPINNCCDLVARFQLYLTRLADVFRAHVFNVGDRSDWTVARLLLLLVFLLDDLVEQSRCKPGALIPAHWAGIPLFLRDTNPHSVLVNLPLVDGICANQQLGSENVMKSVCGLLFCNYGNIMKTLTRLMPGLKLSYVQDISLSRYLHFGDVRSIFAANRAACGTILQKLNANTPSLANQIYPSCNLHSLLSDWLKSSAMQLDNSEVLRSGSDDAPIRQPFKRTRQPIRTRSINSSVRLDQFSDQCLNQSLIAVMLQRAWQRIKAPTWFHLRSMARMMQTEGCEHRLDPLLFHRTFRAMPDSQSTAVPVSSDVYDQSGVLLSVRLHILWQCVRCLCAANGVRISGDIREELEDGAVLWLLVYRCACTQHTRAQLAIPNLGGHRSTDRGLVGDRQMGDCSPWQALCSMPRKVAESHDSMLWAHFGCHDHQLRLLFLLDAVRLMERFLAAKILHSNWPRRS